MKGKFQFVVLLSIICQLLLAQQKGTMILKDISAPSLANSIIGEPVKQPVAVYLPPSYYQNTDKRYPVIYFLPGYGGIVTDYAAGFNGNYYLDRSMNSNITQGRLKEVIMVIVNGYNLLEGSFYYNSPVTGNWEDFVVKDVVTYMDTAYRTISSSGSRAILGFSMGGYGSLHLPMKHPSVFSIGIGQGPGLAAPDGMMKTSLFDDNTIINRVISIMDELNKLPKEEAHQKYMDTIRYYKSRHDWITMFSFAYGSAFAPNVNAKAPYFDYPFSKDNDNNLIKDTAIFKLYERGFGNLQNKVEIYKDSLLKLMGYAIDFGTYDYFQWIPEGCLYYDKLLTDYGIPHKMWEYNGGHGDQHKIRTEQYELPYCNSILIYDTTNLSNVADIEYISSSVFTADPVIDIENKTIILTYDLDADLSSVKPSIYLSPGATIFPALDNTFDLSSDSAQFTVTSENEKNVVTWTIYADRKEGLNKYYNKRQFEVYPNPCMEDFIIKSNHCTIKKVELYDQSGRIVISKKSNTKKIVINRNNLLSGIYYLKICSEYNIDFKKIIYL